MPRKRHLDKDIEAAYDFTLKFRLAGRMDDPEDYINVLAESGCDDALVGVGKSGNISLNFTREASSAFEAVTSAITNVKQAIPEAILIEATPDFVGITDIAKIYGASRQYMRKLIYTETTSFPEPLHEGKPSLWHLADVLCWINDRNPEKIDKELVEVSSLNKKINLYGSLLRMSKADESPYRVEVRTPAPSTDWDKLFRSAFGYARKTPASARP